METASAWNVMLWATIVVQVLGFLSPSLARTSVGQGHQTFCQALFFVSFIGVGVSTMGFLAAGSLWWVFSAGTLGWMAIAATWDCNHASPGTVRQRPSL